jgi:hypothetical protein
MGSPLKSWVNPTDVPKLMAGEVDIGETSHILTSPVLLTNKFKFELNSSEDVNGNPTVPADIL